MRKILLVDDDPVTLELLEKMLESLHEPIIKAHSGEEALNLVNKHNLGLVILDMKMPGINGLETCTRLKNLPKMQHVPIIFFSAKSAEADIVGGFQAGAADYQVKPFNQAVFLARIRYHWAQSETLHRLQEASDRLSRRP